MEETCRFVTGIWSNSRRAKLLPVSTKDESKAKSRVCLMLCLRPKKKERVPEAALDSDHVQQLRQPPPPQENREKHAHGPPRVRRDEVVIHFPGMRLKPIRPLDIVHEEGCEYSNVGR